MKILRAAAISKLPVKTVRYYDDIGMVTPLRGENGYREYSENDVHKLSFLARARGLGFSIKDCKQLLSLYEDENRASSEVKAIADSRLLEIDDKLAKLKELKLTLEKLVADCNCDNRPNCPILEDLAGNGLEISGA